MHTGQNSIAPENSLPQLGQVRKCSVFMGLTAVRMRPGRRRSKILSAIWHILPPTSHYENARGYAKKGAKSSAKEFPKSHFDIWHDGCSGSLIGKGALFTVRSTLFPPKTHGWKYLATRRRTAKDFAGC
jgi:hypothetical protein